MMNRKNFEFKAKVNCIDEYEKKLLTLEPKFIGLDKQVDTYFNAPHGRLKLREGNIENSLINYSRQNTSGSKLSQVILYNHQPDAALKQILTEQLGIKVVVDKKRKIYFIGNVKFHFDVVEKLGTFLEVEAIDSDGNIPVEELKHQCDHYFKFFGLDHKDLVDGSYSDLLMEK